MKNLALVGAVLSFAAFFSCTNPGVVGEARLSCETSEDCPAELPFCDGETNLCYQCLDSSHCGGESPSCSDGVCRCQQDADCATDLACDDGFCSD